MNAQLGMHRGSPGFLWLLCIGIFFGLSALLPPSQAQIRLDGSLGPRRPLAGLRRVVGRRMELPGMGRRGERTVVSDLLRAADAEVVCDGGL